MRITKDKLRQIREEMDQALVALGLKHGLAFRATNATYSDTTFSMKVEASSILSDGSIETQEVADFKRYASSYGLNTSDLGTTFVHQGERFRITGLKPRASKFPIVAERVNDKMSFKFPQATVVRMLKIAHERAATSPTEPPTIEQLKAMYL